MCFVVRTTGKYVNLSSNAQAGGVPVLVLKEGSDRSRGREAQHRNIIAAKVVAESVRSALGPKGMDKKLVDSFADGTALETLEKIALKIDPTSSDYLKKAAMTAMASKLIADYKEYFADIAVKAMLEVATKDGKNWKVDVDDVKVEKKTGESMSDTSLIKGIVLDKEVVHSGMPKRVEKAKIALLDAPLEIEKTEYDAKLHIESPDQIEAFLNQEESMLKDMAEKIAKSGATVVICQKGIDDMAQHFLSKKGIAAIRRAKKSDMEKLSQATGGKIVTKLDAITSGDLGHAALVEERKIGKDKMTFIEGCKHPKAVTILIRGGTDRITAEAERSLHDALCVIRDIMEEPRVLAGGSAPEIEMSKVIRKYADTLPGKEQLAVRIYAEALETIAVVLTESAGLEQIDIISELRTRHENGETWSGIEVREGKIQEMSKIGVFEPL